MGREFPAERFFKPPLKWTEQKIDPDDCADDEDDFGERHVSWGSPHSEFAKIGHRCRRIILDPSRTHYHQL
jgi:hypothetical protein